MIDFALLVARLTARAAGIAEAEAQRRRRSGWWCNAKLLWPNFTKG